MSRLSFETVKALKEAGWPMPGNLLTSPSLSELIEKCPEKVRSEDAGPLVPFQLTCSLFTGWFAGYYHIDRGAIHEATGATPEEAIANLILLGVKDGWIVL